MFLKIQRKSDWTPRITPLIRIRPPTLAVSLSTIRKILGLIETCSPQSKSLIHCLLNKQPLKIRNWSYLNYRRRTIFRKSWSTCPIKSIKRQKKTIWPDNRNKRVTNAGRSSWQIRPRKSSPRQNQGLLMPSMPVDNLSMSASISIKW